MERYAGATSQLKQIEAQEALKIFVMETKQIFFPGKKSLPLAARHHRFSDRYTTGREETINHMGDRIASVQTQGMAL